MPETHPIYRKVCHYEEDEDLLTALSFGFLHLLIFPTTLSAVREEFMRIAEEEPVNMFETLQSKTKNIGKEALKDMNYDLGSACRTTAYTSTYSARLVVDKLQKHVMVSYLRRIAL